AVRGGGIVAACWTSLCLTAIEERSPQFSYHVRIVTGASGGMVGAGLYVATLQGNGVVRTPAERAMVINAMARESLTPVVRRMILRDLPSIFCPYDQSRDRGRVLEQTWEENARG